MARSDESYLNRRHRVGSAKHGRGAIRSRCANNRYQANMLVRIGHNPGTVSADRKGDGHVKVRSKGGRQVMRSLPDVTPVNVGDVEKT